MKGNTFKKTVSAVAAVAMVAQLGFIIPASAEELSVEMLDNNYVVTVNDEGNTLTIPVTNNSGAESTVTAYVASYSGDELTGISLDAASIAAAGADELSLTYDEPGVGETVKLFIWGTNNAPIIKALTVAEGEDVQPTETVTDTPTEDVTETPTEEVTENPGDVYQSWDYTGVTTEDEIANWTTSGTTINDAGGPSISIANSDVEGIGDYLLLGTGSSAGGNRTIMNKFMSDYAISDGKAVLEFDFNMSNGSNRVNEFMICSANTAIAKNTTYTGTDYILKFDQPVGGGRIIINDNTLGDTATSSDVAAQFEYTNGTWLHVKALIDISERTVAVAITDYNTDAEVYTGMLNIGETADNIGGIHAAPARQNSGNISLDNFVYRTATEDDEMGRYYTVTYNVNGNTTSESVAEGEFVQSIPDTENPGYKFDGWKVGDNEELLTTEELAEYPIMADVTITAVYSEDSSYIEPLTSIEFDEFPANGYAVMGENAETSADNIISVKLTGERGTDLGENPDDRVDDFNVDWTFDGFRIIADQDRPTSDDPDSSTYCDSYATVVENGTTANFQLRNQSFNYYGKVTATVTYNGTTLSTSRPMVILGNTAQDSSILLPRGGYIADFDKYDDALVGYEVAVSPDNRTATDILVDNWATYGGNTRTLTLTSDEDGSKFMRLQATGTTSSSFAANQLASAPTGQVIVKQDVRFQTAGSAILLKSTYPTNWPSGSATTMSVNFTGSEINLNGGEAITQASTGVWYTIVMSADVTSGLCYAIVYDEDGGELGRSETVPFADAGSVTPTYICYRTPDRATGILDFNNVTVYIPSMDQEQFTVVSTDETLTIPEEGAEETTATLTASAKSTEGYDMIGEATWTITDDQVTGVTITPNADNSQTAVLSVSSNAQTGTVPIRVTIGGVSKDININLTGTQDSVRFTQSTASISIPLTVGDSDDYTYAAEVVTGTGSQIPDKTVTYAMYDRNNTYELTEDPKGISFNEETGVLTVTSEASATTVYIRATSTNTENQPISRAVRVVIHGLAFDFGTDTVETLVEGYTAVTPTTVYSESAGYGIEGAATVGGTGSVDNADSDYLAGNITFRVNVEPAKVYNVTVNYQGSISSEYVNSDLTGVMLYNTNYADENGTPAMTSITYTIPVIDDVLDLSFSSHDWTVTFNEGEENESTVDYHAAPQVASIVIEKAEDKVAGAIPHVYTVGDSTMANNGSWAYVLARDFNNYTELASLVTFSNNGRGGRNLSSYYTGGELRDRVLTQIRPGDYVVIGNMGTNGMGNSFEDDFNYYVDACIAMGAKVIINSYTPHGPMGGYESGFDSSTNTFNCYRQDSYDEIVRAIYAERDEANDPNVIGFIDIGHMADAAFNAYVDDYTSNGHSSEAEAAQAIIDCFGDHNHYSDGPLACQLMLEGYGELPGIVSSLTDIIEADLGE